MFRNYLKVAVRNLLKYRVYSLINVLGLAVGMACCVLILLFVRDELSFDRFHQNADRIYRVVFQLAFADQPIKRAAVVPTPLAPTVAAEVPEVIAATRLQAYFEAALPGRAAVSHGDKEFNDRFFWTDSSFFKVFSYRLLQGNPDTCFADSYKVVITDKTARKYFGDENPMGQVLRIDSGYTEEDYVVAGVMENVPQNSHLQLDVLASLPSLDHVTDERVMSQSWGDADSYTYILMAEGAAPDEVTEKINQTVARHENEYQASIFSYALLPLTDVHLHSHLLNEMAPNSDVAYVRIFTAVAFLILFVACINFMNLATARSVNRAREVGMRRVVGAHRRQLIGQFLGESVLVALLSMVVALVLVKLSLPAFNAFVNKDLRLGMDLVTWAGLIVMTLGVGIVAGSYPALYLSSFRPVQVLGGTLGQGTRGAFFRRFLVIFQFAFSVLLIIVTLIVFDQLSYMKNFDLGVDIDRVVVLPVRDSSLRHHYLAAKERIEQVPNVTATAFSALTLGREAPQIGTAPATAGEWLLLGSLIIDQDWIDLYGLELVAGRNFSRERGEAEMNSFIVTESGMRELGWQTPEEALGQHVYWFGGKRQGQVIGVVRDFHYQPLRYPIQPIIMLLRPIAYHSLAIKIGPGDLGDTLAALSRKWDEVFPGRPFEYFFLEDEFERMYRDDEQLGKTVGIFSLMAVFLGCLGLLGLASFSAEQRTKEIGIRKTLGAPVGAVVALLSKEFSRLILIAIVVAWPIAYLLVRDWLGDFAYRTEINPAYFLLSGLAALLIAGLTVGFQTLKAAFTNPADALRYE